MSPRINELAERSNEMKDTELKHWGVKGMKWGVRRARKKSTTNWSDDARDAAKLKSRGVKQLSNQELKKLNERTRLEQEYSRLNPSAVRKGWKYVAAAAGVMGTAAAVYNNGGTIVKIGKTVGNKIVDVAGNMILSDLRKNGL